jgi:predicted transcriptional regulator of viral defense system
MIFKHDEEPNMKANLIKWKEIKRSAVVLGIITGVPWRDEFEIAGNDARKLRRMLEETGMVKRRKRGTYEIIPEGTQ